MHRTFIVSTLAALAIAAGSIDADAQAPRRTSVGIAAGASVPVGDLGDAYGTGYHVRGLLEISGTATSPVGFRIEAAYDKLGEKDDNEREYRTISGTGNLILGFPSQSTVTPYVIGGVGIYNTKAEVGDIDIPSDDDDADETTTDFGLNAGFGIKFALSGFNTFAEVRYHWISRDPNAAQFIPIVFGIQF